MKSNKFITLLSLPHKNEVQQNPPMSHIQFIPVSDSDSSAPTNSEVRQNSRPRSCKSIPASNIVHECNATELSPSPQFVNTEVIIDSRDKGPLLLHVANFIIG